MAPGGRQAAGGARAKIRMFSVFPKMSKSDCGAGGGEEGRRENGEGRGGLRGVGRRLMPVDAVGAQPLFNLLLSLVLLLSVVRPVDAGQDDGEASGDVAAVPDAGGCPLALHGVEAAGGGWF